MDFSTTSGCCVIYTRVSTKEQQDGISPEDQEIKCREFAYKNNLKVIDVFPDLGTSGTKINRPVLISALKIMNKGDTILVLSTSRLSRDSIFALNLLEKLKNEDKFIWFINENIDTRTPHGYLVATMLFGVAQYQVQETKARIRSTLALKKRKVNLWVAFHMVINY